MIRYIVVKVSIFSLNQRNLNTFLFIGFVCNIFVYSEIVFIILVVNQLYTVNVMDESVLRGNTAILKCHIPSFVADYVFVSGWISDYGDEYSINANQAHGIEKKYIFILFYIYSVLFGLGNLLLKNNSVGLFRDVLIKYSYKARVRCGFPFFFQIFLLFSYIIL